MSAQLVRFVPVVVVALMTGQLVPLAGQTSPAAALAVAREAQRRFERERIAWSPENRAGRGVICDEIIGRICHDGREGGDWYPGPEDAHIGAARDTLLGALGRAAAAAPDDPWILGQRVFNLGEAGQWERADSLATAACAQVEGRGNARSDPEGALPPGVWCRALEGLALHGLGRYVEAEQAFRAALAGMDPTDAEEWLDPEPDLDVDGRSWLKGLSESARRDRAALVWSLADPLLLVPGNDALTEFLARRTLALARASSRSAYGLTWGSDLEELMLRYGTEVGWERVASRPLESGPLSGIGHHHPESRPLLPGGSVLRDPAASDEIDWFPDLRSARSGYAPPYAAVVLPGEGQLALFPRGDRFVLVGAHKLPDDTTYHAKHDHASRAVVLVPWRGLASEAGLFLTPVDGGPVLASRSAGNEEGSLMVEAPAGRWMASLEVFAPEQRRAGRTRLGVAYAGSPPDVPTLSDLLLVAEALPDGATLEDAAARARPRSWLAAGERVAIAWELFGAGDRVGSLTYRLWVEKAQGGLLRSFGRRLGLIGAPANRSLEWEEPGGEGPRPLLRSIEIELPRVEPGDYRIHLEVGMRGRTLLVREKAVTIRPAPLPR